MSIFCHLGRGDLGGLRMAGGPHEDSEQAQVESERRKIVVRSSGSMRLLGRWNCELAGRSREAGKQKEAKQEQEQEQEQRHGRLLGFGVADCFLLLCAVADDAT